MPTRLFIFVALLPTFAQAGEPIKLLSENPHYFVFRGHATPLVASTEHYGSVLNLDFNQMAYLDELKAAGLNYTRHLHRCHGRELG